MLVITTICFKPQNIQGNSHLLTYLLTHFLTYSLTHCSRNPYLVDIYKELLPLYINYRSNGTHSLTYSFTHLLIYLLTYLHI